MCLSECLQSWESCRNGAFLKVDGQTALFSCPQMLQDREERVSWLLLLLSLYLHLSRHANMLFLSQRSNNCLQSFNLPITCVLTHPHGDGRQNFGLIFPRHGKAAKQVGIPSITTLRDTHSLNGWLMRWNGTEWIPRARSHLDWATEMAWPPHAIAPCPPSDSATHLTLTYMHKHTHPLSSSHSLASWRGCSAILDTGWLLLLSAHVDKGRRDVPPQ